MINNRIAILNIFFLSDLTLLIVRCDLEVVLNKVIVTLDQIDC